MITFQQRIHRFLKIFEFEWSQEAQRAQMESHDRGNTGLPGENKSKVTGNYEINVLQTTDTLTLL